MSFKLEKGDLHFVICFVKQQPWSKFCNYAADLWQPVPLGSAFYLIQMICFSLSQKPHFIISCPCSHLFNILSRSLLLSCSNNYKVDGSSSRAEMEQRGNEVCSPVSVIKNNSVYDVSESGQRTHAESALLETTCLQQKSTVETSTTAVSWCKFYEKDFFAP